MSTKKTITDINTLLVHKRCIFMTLDQYKKKAHINDKIYTNVSIVKDVKKHVIDHIKSVAKDAPFNKVPRPIYVMISKKLEYDEGDSIIFGKCNNEIGAYSKGTLTYKEIEKIDKGKPETYEGYNPSCFYGKDNKYSKNEMDDYKFIYNNVNEDIEKLKGSSLSSYKFRGNYEVVISIPNLTKDKKFFTSYFDFYKQNMFMNLIVNNNDYLSIITIDKEIPEVFKTLIRDPAQYKKFVNFYNRSSVENYPLVKDLTYMCYDLGCSSDSGEDLQQIVPKLSDNYDDLVNNAKSKAPYFPTKCLRTSYYKDHMIDYTSSEYNNELKEKLLEGVKTYKENIEKIKRGEEPTEQSGDNIVDVLKNTAFSFRNEKYKDDKYSSDYNRKILSELAFRYNTVPGVQEMVFSVFKVNDSFAEINNITSIMPWGNKLLEKGMVLPEGESFDIDNDSLKSFNKQYEVKMFFNRLVLFKNKGIVRIVINENFSAYTRRSLVIENGFLTIYGYNADGHKDNRYNINVVNYPDVKPINPISLIVENDGKINIYDNGFNIIGSL